MTKRILSISLIFILPLIAITSLSQPLSEKKGAGPIIYFDKTTYTFPAVFDGEKLSHSFTVLNRGTRNLELKKVTHS